MPVLYLFIVALSWRQLVWADDIVMPVGGQCESGYALIDGLCLSLEAADRLTSAAMMSKIYAFKEAHRNSSNSKVICQTEVFEKDGDFFKLSNGAVAEQTSYGSISYLNYSTAALLIYDGTIGTILLEDESVEVELIRPPSHCDSPSLYMVEAVTSNKAIINDQIFEIWGYCANLDSDDQVVFTENSAAWGGCLNTKIYNVSSGGEPCTLYCQ